MSGTLQPRPDGGGTEVSYALPEGSAASADQPLVCQFSCCPATIVPATVDAATGRVSCTAPCAKVRRHRWRLETSPLASGCLLRSEACVVCRGDRVVRVRVGARGLELEGVATTPQLYPIGARPPGEGNKLFSRWCYGQSAGWR